MPKDKKTNHPLTSTDKYKLIYDLAPEAIVILDNKGTLIEANNRLKDWLGYDPKDLAGKNLSKLPILNEKSRAIAAKNFAARMLGKKVLAYKLEFIHKNGTVMMGEVRDAPIKNSQKKIIGDLVMIANISPTDTIHDTDSSHQHELELKKLKAAVENSSEIIFMTDADGLINYINPAFTKVYGYTKEEIIGKTTPRILKGGKKSQSAYQAFWQTIKSGSIARWEIENKTKSGQLIYIEAAVNPIKDEQNKVVGFLAIQSDVTDRRFDRQKIEESVRQTQKLNDLMIGRELKMIDLKDQIKQLNQELVAARQSATPQS